MRLAMIFAFATAALAQTLPPGVRKAASVEGVTEYDYANGLRVLLFSDPSKVKFTVRIAYLAGSRHEGYGEAGMAHLLEHLAALRTKDRDVKKDLEGHGAVWNAVTSYDSTNYFETVLASDENLRWALALEAERMVNTRLEKQLLETEMTVVRNELEMGESDVSQVLIKGVLATAFRFHNYGRSPAGTRSDIEHVPIERVAAFYRKYYQPDNAVLVITGNFDESRALALAAETLGKIPRPQRTLEPTYTVEPTQDGERSVTLRRAGDGQSLVALYHVPAAAHPDTAALAVLAGILGPDDGRLNHEMISGKAARIGVDYEPLHDPGFLSAGAWLGDEHSLADARAGLLGTVEHLADHPPDAEELRRAKIRLLKQADLAIRDTGEFGAVLAANAAYGDWRLFFYNRDQVKKVTAQDVRRVAKAYIKSSNRTLGTFIPTSDPDRAEIPAAPAIENLLKDYRGGAPISKGESFDVMPANIEARVVRTSLPSGLKLVMLPKKTLGGTVVARLNVWYGDERSLAGKEAIADITGTTLSRGTKTKDEGQLQAAMDALKANISVDGNIFTAFFRIETVEPDLEPALRLAAEMLREPSFAADKFEDARQSRIRDIEDSVSDPQTLASTAFARQMNPFPPDDPRYSATPVELIAARRKVTVDQVRDFHRRFYGASRGELVVVGQFDPSRIRKLAAELFGDWKSPGPYVRATNPYRAIEPATLDIRTPDKQNAFFIAGRNFRMNDDDPDYAALTLAMYIVGGSNASRMFRRIRDREGLSYNVYAEWNIPEQDDNATFSVRAISNPIDLAKVEASVKDELARIARDGFADEEVAKARAAWLDRRKAERTEDGSLLDILSSREYWGRTMKWDEALEAKVASLTATQVSEAFRRRVDIPALTIIRSGAGF
jgi:zinc protease